MGNPFDLPHRSDEHVRLRHVRSSTQGYVSEFTQFIDEFLKTHPEAIEEQGKGWNIFWDKNVDLSELKKANTDSVAPKPYPYD